MSREAFMKTLFNPFGHEGSALHPMTNGDKQDCAVLRAWPDSDGLLVWLAFSCGGFTTAYYALYGDQIFTEFDQQFLNQNTQRQILWRFCSQPIF